jgi:hypothetical protein
MLLRDRKARPCYFQAEHMLMHRAVDHCCRKACGAACSNMWRVRSMTNLTETWCSAAAAASLWVMRPQTNRQLALFDDHAKLCRAVIRLPACS